MNEATLETIQAVALVATLWATGLGLGMKARPSDIPRSLTRRWLVARTITLDVVLVPIAMWVAVRLLVQDEGYATGLLLVAFAAAGPLGIKLAQATRADTAFAIGIVLVLEFANIVLIPLWSSLLGLASSTSVAFETVRTVALLVALPLAVGMTVRSLRPGLASPWADVALRLSTVGLVVVVTIIVIRSLDTMVEGITNGAASAAIVVIAFALGAGWLMGGPQRETRLATSVVTGCRSGGAALAVAATAFADQPAVTAGVVTAGLVSVTLPTLLAYAVAWRSTMAAGRLESAGPR